RSRSRETSDAPSEVSRLQLRKTVGREGPTMRTGTVFGLAVLATAALLALTQAQQAEPASPYEIIVKDMLGTVDSITKTLGTIVDEDSIEAARPDLRKAGQKLVALRKQADSVKQPDKEEKDRLELMYRVRFEEALKKLRSESLRVKAIPGGDDVLKEFAIPK